MIVLEEEEDVDVFCSQPCAQVTDHDSRCREMRSNGMLVSGMDRMAQAICARRGKRVLAVCQFSRREGNRRLEPRSSKSEAHS